MDIRIKTSDYEITTEVSAYLNEKIVAIEKILSDDAGTARCEVEVGRAVGSSQQGNVWRAEFIVMHGGERLRAEAMGESVNAAIDIAKDEILQQLRKSKGRSQTLSKRIGGRLKRWARLGDIRGY